jgi:putative tryptophan/tyrosine transport system substrate-binding protein
VKRRVFITLLGGAAAWPLAARAARAQQRERMRRIGVLMSLAADDPEGLARVTAFAQGLQQLMVEGLAHPGGNTTGFSIFEYSISGKWLELLKEIAPRVRRAAVIRDHLLTSGTAQFSVIQSVAHALGAELSPVGARGADDIERGLSTFAREPNGGVIVTASPLIIVHRNLIITLVARHQLPAVYPFRYFATSGGLISYGPDVADQYRRAAGYVDRILKGEKPGDLPVQAPTKYELVINLKTAKALGLEIPPTLLARADEVIE